MALRYHFFPTNPIKVPELLSVGCSSDTAETHFGPAKRNEYLIHYVVSGKGYFNGTPVGKGYGFLIHPQMYEYYYPDENDPWTYLWFISKDSSMGRIYETYGADPESKVFKFRNVHIVENTIDLLTSAPNGMSFTAMQLTELFLNIYNNCIYTDSRNEVSNAKLYIDFSISYINTHLHLPLKISKLCEKLGVSQSYLYRIFKNALGCSPKEYILQTRLSAAKRLLSETDLQISMVASAVGFSDPLAFSRFFSLEEKLSPTEFRKCNQAL